MIEADCAIETVKETLEMRLVSLVVASRSDGWTVEHGRKKKKKASFVLCLN